MNGRQRVAAAIARRKTDRPPVSYEATYEVTAALIRRLGIDRSVDGSMSSSRSNQPSAGQKEFGLAHELELQRRLGIDQAIVICPTNPERTVGNWWGLPLLERLTDGRMRGAWGILFREFEYPFGTYIEIDSCPLQGASSLAELAEVPEPSLELWDFRGLKEVLALYPDTFVWLNMNGCFDFARFMRGTEQFLMDMVAAPEMAEVLLDKVNRLAISFFQECMKAAGNSFDGVYLGDDFGTQQGMLMSPDIWRRLIRPRYERLLSVIKAHGKKYCHHTCGGVREIIPDLIDMGVDVLNPIQPLATGMDPEELAEEFGEKIAFYGGIDEQRTLPTGTPADVRSEVLHRIGTLGRHGGYIVAPSHAFQPDTPLENVLAVYETVLDRRIT
jgi:uroporphyrinogen decarboxylase